MSKEIQIKQECCDIWNNLKDKTKMIDYLFENKQRIAELEEQLENATKQRKTHKNYSGFDLVNDLVKPCRVCGVKPQICDLYGYPEKYQIACMNCNCVNRDITSDDNFYVVIDLWNKLQGENK